MKQLSLAETGFLPKRGKVTRKAEFLAEMNMVVPISLHTTHFASAWQDVSIAK